MAGAVIAARIFRAEPAALIAALASPDLLARYVQALADELPALADRSAARHLRRMSLVASRALGSGFDTLAAEDRTAADALLTDLFAVATWHGWELPIAPLGERELEPPRLPAGLLGADAATDGARLWLLPDGTVALARAREAGDEADMGGHARA